MALMHVCGCNRIPQNRDLDTPWRTQGGLHGGKRREKENERICCSGSGDFPHYPTIPNASTAYVSKGRKQAHLLGKCKESRGARGEFAQRYTEDREEDETDEEVEEEEEEEEEGQCIDNIGTGGEGIGSGSHQRRHLQNLQQQHLQQQAYKHTLCGPECAYSRRRRSANNSGISNNPKNPNSSNNSIDPYDHNNRNSSNNPNISNTRTNINTPNNLNYKSEERHVGGIGVLGDVDVLGDVCVNIKEVLREHN